MKERMTKADEGENDKDTLSNNEDTLSANYYDIEDIIYWRRN